jgi:hypothetical protein
MTYFVTETYLKTNTGVNKNVDANSCIYSIKTSAEMWTRSVLGTYFFENLLTRFNNQTLNSDETALVQNYIQPSIAFRTAAEIALEASISLHNKGLQKQNGDFSMSVEQRDMGFYMQNQRQKAEFYQQRLFDYLVDNPNMFPDFANQLNNDSTAKRQCLGFNSCCDNPDVGNFQSGIWFIS